MKKTLLALLLPLALMSQAQTTDVPFNGLIVDMNNNPVKKARIYISDENRYAMSDKQGRFGLTNVKDTDTLHVKYGGINYEIPVEGMKSIKIRLADQSKYTAESDETLVSIGYDYVKSRERNTPNSTITGEELVRTGRFDLIEALNGKVPGLSFSSGEYGSGAHARIRNSGSLNGPSEPIYIVDGMQVETLFGISVYVVDHVEILKDASIYGSQGGNGAIVVYTKKGHDGVK